MQNPQIRNVAVFCGAQNTVDEEYRVLARQTGELISKNNLTLVYGGTTAGLLGEVAKSTHATGGKVLGVYPNSLNTREPINPNLDFKYIVDTLYERKEIMNNKADAFIILPGGVGTLDEAFEVITLRILAAHNKPIIFVDHKNYWKFLNDLIKHIVDHKFATASVFDTYRFVSNPKEAFEKLGF